ncbi:MAG: hypothetical protein RPR28_07795 [Cycloclasticus sp.]|jgi:hypothetical protein
MTLDELEEYFGFFGVHVRGDRLVGFNRYMYSVAIVVDVDYARNKSQAGYKYRYCYKTLREALEAMDDWDGVGEPKDFEVRKGLGIDYAPKSLSNLGEPLC